MRAARRDRIIGGARLEQGRCLEVGPLSNPVVDPGVADVRYVDVVDRAGLIAHYRGNPAVDPDAIPDIHFWLTRDDGSIATLAETVAADAPFQHVVASHVIEHVPDLIGWLRDVAEVLADDGALLLAIPDRRFTFDARRPPTTVGQVVQAHLDGDRTPSARAVLDHFLDAVHRPADAAWRGDPLPADASHSLEEARAQLDRQRTGAYVDCHVWPTTPAGFAELMGDLVALDLVDFAVERITATRDGHSEFYVTLRRFARHIDRDTSRAAATSALAEVSAALPDESRAWPHPEREAELLRRQAQLEQQLADAEELVVQARSTRDRARHERDRARARATQLEQERAGLGARVARRLRRSLPRRG